MHIKPLFRPGGDFFLIAGPCVVENHVLHMQIASALRDVQEELGIPVIFKASFDKANRSRMEAARGPGFVEGLQMLADVSTATALPVLTDVHEVGQVDAAAQVCHVLQVPAALCRQTDLLVEVALSGRAVNIKKGQWCSTADMLGAVGKVRYNVQQDDYPVAVTERGTFFGYGDLVVDMRSIPRLQQACKTPVVFDATHSVQRPGLGAQGQSGGEPGHIATLARAAVAAGADGLFLEVHPTPELAPCDADSMLPLDQLLPLMRQLVAIRRVVYG